MAVSAVLHAVLLGLAVLWATRAATPVAVELPDQPAIVQLVMSPPGGLTQHAAPPQPETPPAPEQPTPQQAAAQIPPAAPADDDAPAAATAPPQPAQAPPSVNHRLQFDFASTESDTNALVTGDLVVPPSPNIRFHNRKPSYPVAAAYRHEQGTVVLLVHVAADGLVNGADVVRSSGYPALDDAARDAVLTWHFLPSIKDGQPVAADFPMRFLFALD